MRKTTLALLLSLPLATATLQGCFPVVAAGAGLLPEGTLGLILLAGAVVIGGAIGLWRARVVEMTGMPELIALLHSFVGLAAVLVGWNGHLHAEGIACATLDKEGGALAALRSGAIDLVINVPREYDERGRPDGFLIRRAAVDLEIPLLTDLWLARRVVGALCRLGRADLHARPWHAYVPSARRPR